MSRIMALVIGVCLVLCGCGPRTNWAGEWRGERLITTPPDGNQAIARSLAIVKLTIRPDGTFDLTEETFGKSGSATLDATTGTLRIDRVLGRNPGTLGPDGETLGGQRSITMREDGSMLFYRDGFDPIVLSRYAPGSSGAQ